VSYIYMYLSHTLSLSPPLSLTHTHTLSHTHTHTHTHTQVRTRVCAVLWGNVQPQLVTTSQLHRRPAASEAQPSGPASTSGTQGLPLNSTGAQTDTLIRV